MTSVAALQCTGYSTAKKKRCGCTILRGKYYCYHHVTYKYVNTYFSLLPRDITKYILNFIHTRYSLGKYLRVLPPNTIDLHVSMMKSVDPFCILEFGEIFFKCMFEKKNVLLRSDKLKMIRKINKICAPHIGTFFEKINTLLSQKFIRPKRIDHETTINFVYAHGCDDVNIIDNAKFKLENIITQKFGYPTKLFTDDLSELYKAYRYILLTHVLELVNKGYYNIHLETRCVDYRHLKSVFCHGAFQRLYIG